MAEVRGVLERRVVAPAVMEVAIAELRSDGYLDDARYARRFAEDKRALQGWGAERIATDLARRGVAADLVAAALSARDPEAELTAATALLAARFPTAPSDDRSRGRALALLRRRGYELEVAYAAVRAHERAFAVKSRDVV